MMDEKSKKTWCPLCDQGWVKPVAIIANYDTTSQKINGLLCQECEAFWPQGMEITAEPFIQLNQLLGQWRDARSIALYAIETDEQGNELLLPW